MNEERKWELLAKYLSGECSDDEKDAVKKWLDESEENRSQYESVKKVWNTPDEQFDSSDIQALWKNVAERSGITSTDQTPVHKMQPGADFSAKLSEFYRSSAFRIAALILVIVSAALIFYFNVIGPAPDDWKTITVQNRSVETIELDDGSKIVADAGSEVQIIEKFGIESREIRLTGEAYFEVESNAELPFTVYAGNAVVEVAGTKFNVRAFKESEVIKASVIEGTIVFRSSLLNDSLILTEGLAAGVKKDGTMTPVEEAGSRKTPSWIDGEIYFENTRVTEIIAQIERWYDVTIKLPDKSVGDERLSVFIHNYSLIDNIDLVSRLTSTKYTIVDNNVTLRPAN